jgi:hypothetical protein
VLWISRVTVEVITESIVVASVANGISVVVGAVIDIETMAAKNKVIKINLNIFTDFEINTTEKKQVSW